MVRIIYSDSRSKEYATKREAEKDILEIFAGSEGDVAPAVVDEFDDLGEHISVLSCEWKVHLVEA